MKTIFSSVAREGKWDLSAISDGQRIGLRSHVELASESLSFVYRMTTFIHHNPLHELEELPFFEAIRKAGALFGGRTSIDPDSWRDLYRRGRIERGHLLSILQGEAMTLGLCLGGEGISHETVRFLGRPLVELLEGHLLHEWDRPLPSDPIMTEGRPAFFRLRRDLASSVRARHESHFEREGEEGYCARLWDACRQFASDRLPGAAWSDPSASFLPRPGPSLTLLEWVDIFCGGIWKKRVDRLMVKWLSAFLDEGISTWNLPHRERGFYRVWRSMAEKDREILFWGLEAAHQEIPELPDNPEDTLMGSLVAMEIPRAGLTDYLERHATALPGWTGYVKWRNSKSDDVWSRTYPIDLVMVLAVRLFYEQAVVAHVCETMLGIPGTVPAIGEWIEAHRPEMLARSYAARYGTPMVWGARLGALADRFPDPGDPRWQKISRVHEEWLESLRAEGGSRSRAGRLYHMAQTLGWSPSEISELDPRDWERLEAALDTLDSPKRHEIWQRALEDGSDQEALSLFDPWTERHEEPGGLPVEARPAAQMFFCIDVRSELLRRHIESLGGYATYGIAGFFGVPFRFQPYQKEGTQVQAPVLLSPRHRVREIPRAYEIERADRHFRRHQKTRSLVHLFHELKDHVITPYVLVEALGWFYLLPFLGRTFLPATFERVRDFFRGLILPEIATALTVARVGEAEAQAMIEAEQHVKIRKALLDVVGSHTRQVSPSTVEEVRQAALSDSRLSQGFSLRAREELLLTAPGEADLIKKLRTLYTINMRRTRVLLETIMTVGFGTEEQAYYVENSLRTIGLTRNFARLVLVCGHGSESFNNPFESALDCGACGGNRGISNARVFVEMANNPAVRDLLKKRGIEIPYDTHFLSGEHNTTTDRIVFYDLESVPLTHRRDLKRLWRDLEEAGLRSAEERQARLPSFETPSGPRESSRAVFRRSCDAAEVRPEWGLSRNSWFIVGNKELLGTADLAGRAFLHSYDPVRDPDGRLLEAILTGPLVVGQWINAEHYFSLLDPERYGGGNKIYHNVAGAVGIMWGNESDLLPGLPAQTLMDGDRLYHEPLRLLVVVQAGRERIDRVVSNNPPLRRLLVNGWVRLVAADPGERAFFRMKAPGDWSPVNATTLSQYERTL